MQDKVAFEEHFVTPGLRDTIFGSIGWEQQEWQQMVEALQETDEGRLGAMDEAGIEVAVLSLAAPCIQDEFELSRAIARASEANDALAEIIASHPDRYVGLAALPLQDPVAAADELERCVTELGFRGALANGYSSVGDLEHAPATTTSPATYRSGSGSAICRFRSICIRATHCRPSGATTRARELLLGPTWAFTVETATHALRLIVSGLFDQLPSLQIILGHMGELLPFAVARTQQRLSHIPGIRSGASARRGAARELLADHQRQLPHARRYSGR